MKGGKLVHAGPFIDDGNLRGNNIFEMKTVEEAKTFIKNNPALQAGSLVN